MGIMSRRLFSLTHVLVLGDTPQFLLEAKREIFGKFFLKSFSNGGLLFHKGKKCEKTKK